MMAQLVLHHRRKLKSDALDVVESLGGRKLVYLCLILRLAAQSSQSRTTKAAAINLNIISADHWQVLVGAGMHKELIATQLEQDVPQFAKWGVQLDVVSTGEFA